MSSQVWANTVLPHLLTGLSSLPDCSEPSSEVSRGICVRLSWLCVRAPRSACWLSAIPLCLEFHRVQKSHSSHFISLFQHCFSYSTILWPSRMKLRKKLVYLYKNKKEKMLKIWALYYAYRPSWSKVTPSWFQSPVHELIYLVAQWPCQPSVPIFWLSSFKLLFQNCIGCFNAYSVMTLIN